MLLLEKKSSSTGRKGVASGSKGTDCRMFIDAFGSARLLVTVMIIFANFLCAIMNANDRSAYLEYHKSNASIVYVFVQICVLNSFTLLRN